MLFERAVKCIRLRSLVAVENRTERLIDVLIASGASSESNEAFTILPQSVFWLPLSLVNRAPLALSLHRERKGHLIAPITAPFQQLMPLQSAGEFLILQTQVVTLESGSIEIRALIKDALIVENELPASVQIGLSASNRSAENALPPTVALLPVGVKKGFPFAPSSCVCTIGLTLPEFKTGWSQPVRIAISQNTQAREKQNQVALSVLLQDFQQRSVYVNLLCVFGPNVVKVVISVPVWIYNLTSSALLFSEDNISSVPDAPICEVGATQTVSSQASSHKERNKVRPAVLGFRSPRQTSAEARVYVGLPVNRNVAWSGPVTVARAGETATISIAGTKQHTLLIRLFSLCPFPALLAIIGACVCVLQLPERRHWCWDARSARPHHLWTVRWLWSSGLVMSW